MSQTEGVKTQAAMSAGIFSPKIRYNACLLGKVDKVDFI